MCKYIIVSSDRIILKILNPVPRNKRNQIKLQNKSFPNPVSFLSLFSAKKTYLTSCTIVWRVCAETTALAIRMNEGRAAGDIGKGVIPWQDRFRERPKRWEFEPEVETILTRASGSQQSRFTKNKLNTPFDTTWLTVHQKLLQVVTNAQL